jgi:hypothetical protein
MRGGGPSLPKPVSGQIFPQCREKCRENSLKRGQGFSYTSAASSGAARLDEMARRLMIITGLGPVMAARCIGLSRSKTNGRDGAGSCRNGPLRVTFAPLLGSKSHFFARAFSTARRNRCDADRSSLQRLHAPRAHRVFPDIEPHGHTRANAPD